LSDLGENQTSYFIINPLVDIDQNSGLNPLRRRSFTLGSNFPSFVLFSCFKIGA